MRCECSVISALTHWLLGLDDEGGRYCYVFGLDWVVIVICGRIGNAREIMCLLRRFVIRHSVNL